MPVLLSMLAEMDHMQTCSPRGTFRVESHLLIPVIAGDCLIVSYLPQGTRDHRNPESTYIPLVLSRVLSLSRYMLSVSMGACMCVICFL